MWDELILVWNMKLLLKEWKKIFIACSNKDWLKNFHSNFFSEDTLKNIVYLQELPKWFRSSIKFFKNIKDLKHYFSIDSILIWWWEIFTEETPWSYWYWFFSVWFLLFTKKLYLSWWIQIPKKIWNKIPFSILTKKAKKLFLRDYEFQNWPWWKLKEKSVFFPDTSIFVYDDVDLKNYKWNTSNLLDDNFSNKFIVINVNKRAEKFLDEIEEKIEFYYKNNYDIYFVPVCKSPKDQDIVYYHRFKKKYVSMKLLEWEDFNNFIKILAKAEKVFTTRLHLFLVAFYLNCDVNPFSYQKKVDKMKEVLLKK